MSAKPAEIVRVPDDEPLRAARISASGGQALHVFDPQPFCRPGTATCFKRAKRAGHLLDQDAGRLLDTAARLGVRRVYLHHGGTRLQHVDLCGKPLERAIAEARPAVAGEGERT